MPDINFAAPTKPKNNTKYWVIVAILTLIPIVNIVMYCLWFGQKTSLYDNTWDNVNRSLLIGGLVISILITVIVGILLFGVLTGDGGALQGIVNATKPYTPTTGYPKNW